MGGDRGDPRRRRGPARRRASSRRRHRPIRTASRARRSGSPTCRIPDPIAYPLAWLTTRVYLRPRGHVVADDQRDPRPSRAIAGPVLLAHGEDDAVVPLGHLERLAPRPLGGACRRPGCGTRGRHRDRRRPALVAVRVRGVSPSRGPVPGRARSAVRYSPTRLPSAPPPSPPSGCPTRRAVLGRRDGPGGCRTLAQVALPGATRSRRRAIVAAAGARPSRHRAGLGRGHSQARDPPLRRPAARRRAPRTDPRRRPASRQLQELAALGVHRLSRPATTCASCERRAVRRAPGRRGRGDRPRHAGPDDGRRAAVGHVRPRAGGPEHDACRLGARDRQRAGDGLRARPRPQPPRLPGRPALRVPAVVRLPGRPRPTSPGRRRPAAGCRSSELVHEERW